MDEPRTFECPSCGGELTADVVGLLEIETTDDAAAADQVAGLNAVPVRAGAQGAGSRRAGDRRPESVRREDPTLTLTGDGFANVLLRVPAAERYSYVFNGEAGHLDQSLE